MLPKLTKIKPFLSGVLLGFAIAAAPMGIQLIQMQRQKAKTEQELKANYEAAISSLQQQAAASRAAAAQYELATQQATSASSTSSSQLKSIQSNSELSEAQRDAAIYHTLQQRLDQLRLSQARARSSDIYNFAPAATSPN